MTGRLLLTILISVCLTGAAYADLDVPERRKDQFATDSGYYIIPTPYSIPGLGDGIIVAGAITNVNNSYTDLYAFTATGDIKGYGIFGVEMHLLDKELILDLTATSFEKATSQVYRQRGMKTTADDYVLAELDKSDFTGARLTYTGWDRRFEFYGLLYNNSSRLKGIRNPDGTLIQSTINSETERTQNVTWGLRLDFTDDYIDPRKGVRFESSLWHSPPDTADNPEFDIIEFNLTGYLPVGKRDTLAFNYFQADAHVDKPGETNPAIVESDLGLNCNTGTPQNQIDCQSIVDNTVANNSFGTVGSLGGLSRLRAYPEDRFKGSHARFLGMEYRWNFVEAIEPFDFFIAKDIRTVIQMAVFYERGAIDDDKDSLWGNMREVYGIGARLVTKSGLVFRADIADGDEGSEISVIFGYPWEVF